MGVWNAMASAGPYANNLHLAPDRKNTTLSFFTGWMLCLTPNQQRQSTEVTSTVSQRLKLTELGAAVA